MEKTMRYPVLLFATLAGLAVAALAQESNEVSIGFAKSEVVDPATPRWIVCSSVIFAEKKKWVGSIVETTEANTANHNHGTRWREALKEQFGIEDNLYGGCNVEKSAEDAAWRYSVFVTPDPNHPKQLFLVEWKMKPPQAQKGSAKKQGGTKTTETSSSIDLAAQERAERARLLREENEAIRARNKAEAEAHQRELTAYEVKKAAHEQMLADHRASIAKASAERAAHDVKLAEAAAAASAHEKQMADYQRKLTNPAAKGTEGTFQSTGMLRPTRNEAMANLLSMSFNLPELFDIQCNERKMVPVGWTCFGKYRQTVSRSSVAKQ